MERWGFWESRDSQENLLCVCNGCHARKTALERKLFKGDVIGFGYGLLALNYPVDKIISAFSLAGLSLRWLPIGVSNAA